MMTTPFEQIRQSLSLEDLVGREDLPLESEGKTKRTLCPHHADSDPSCRIYPDDRYYCFACGSGGDVSDFHAALRGLEPGVDATYAIAEEFGIELPDLDSALEKRLRERRRRERELLGEARELHEKLANHPEIERWWEERGFSEELRREFLLGGSDPIATVPYWDRTGRPQAIITRNLGSESPKYQYPPIEEFASKTRPLMVFGPKISSGKSLFLVEGPLDGLAVAASGATAVALGGDRMSITQRQEFVELVSGYSRLKFIPLLDDDDAGKEATVEMLDRAEEVAEDLVLHETKRIVDSEPGEMELLELLTEKVMPLVAKEPRVTTREYLTWHIQQVSGIQKAVLNKALKSAVEELERKRVMAESAEEIERRRREQQELAELIKARQPEIDELFGGGVLDNLRDRVSVWHVFRGREQDQKALALMILVVASSQLALRPNGKPSGSSVLISATAGRGKNYLTDAAVLPFPEEWIYRFESSSEKAFYYDMQDDPNLLKHTFVYPNEIEGVKNLIEFFRPLISSGKAKHKTTVKIGDMIVSVTLTAEGPISIAVPTVRNVISDNQFFSRLLMIDLPDYPGRVKEHSKAVSELYSPDFVVGDYEDELFLWRMGMRQLAENRMVVFPGIDNEDFAFDDDKIEHGARVWANFLGLCAANAWLEQKNRSVITYRGSRVIVGEPEDYEAVYKLFEVVGKRSILNLSDVHRKILKAIHELNRKKGYNVRGWTQNEVAKKADIAQSTVSKQITYLKTSAKLLSDEVGTRLQLASGVNESNWDERHVLDGFPRPEDYRKIWHELEEDDPDDDGPDDGEGGGHTRPSPSSNDDIQKAENTGNDGIISDGNRLDPDEKGENFYPLVRNNPEIAIPEYSGNGHHVEKMPEGVPTGMTEECYSQYIPGGGMTEKDIDEPYSPALQKEHSDILGIPASEEVTRPTLVPDDGEALLVEKMASSAAVTEAKTSSATIGFITKPEELDELVEKIKRSSWAAIDLEGRLDIPAGREGIRVFSIAMADGVFLVDARAVDITPGLKALQKVDLYVHGKEFDLPTLMVNFGFNPKGRIFDTLNASRAAYPGEYMPLDDGDFERADHSLPAVLKRELSVELPDGAKQKYQKPEAWLGKKGEGLPALTEEHSEYSAADVRYLKGLHDALLKRMEELGQKEVYEKLELPIQKTLLKMMARGIPVDLAAWDREVSSLETELQRVEKRLRELAPPPPDEKGWTFANPNPRAKVKRDALSALEAHGVELADTKEKTLKRHLAEVGEDEFVCALMEYRIQRSVLSRQKKFLKGRVREGRIHSKLSSYGTETGRITTSNPNLQGLDNKRAVWRACIRDPKGKRSILSADLDQIELRILARVSGDEELLSVYRDGKEDLHTSTAKDATGIPNVEKKSVGRTIAKRVNFGIAYGASPYGIYNRLTEEGYYLTQEDVDAFFRAFFERFPGVKEWQEEQGYKDSFVTESLLGRKRFISPLLKGPRVGWPNREERLNGPIQSTGADILKLILRRLDEEEPPYARLLLPVHDEVVVEIDEGYEEQAKEWVSGVMRWAVQEVLGKELAGEDCVEVEIKKSWGE